MKKILLFLSVVFFSSSALAMEEREPLQKKLRLDEQLKKEQLVGSLKDTLTVANLKMMPVKIY